MHRIIPPWSIVVMDAELGDQSSSIDGQFDSNYSRSLGSPIWVVKNGRSGGRPWLRHVGIKPEMVSFDFHFIAENVVDTRPTDSLSRLVAMTEKSPLLGRPPRVLFRVPDFQAVGYITDIPDDVKIQRWFNLGTTREIGPIRITLVIDPRAVASAPESTGTAFETRHSNTQLEEIADTYYGQPSLWHALDLINQDVPVGGTLVIPPRRDPRLTLAPSLSPFMEP